MKLLFIQGGSRVRVCSNGRYYVDGNFNNDIWKRYKNYCDELTVILRKIDKIYLEEEVKNKLNYIDIDLLSLKLVDDIYSPKKKILNLSLRKKIEHQIKNEVSKSDKVIIRSVGNFYTNTALKYCKKYKKDYLIEVTGFAFESLWYHSSLGKIVAIPREIKVKKALKNAPYAVYVTDEELQKRYPSRGKTLGCSDVELFEQRKNTLSIKQEKINEDLRNNKIVLGTAAFLDVSFKGQKDVIKAINYLKKEGFDNIYYEMIGAGNGEKLKKIIDKYNLNDRIKIIGALKHDEVAKWLMNIDIYIQPSYMEGLCRSILEAMGMGCPIICSNVGGNKELISKECIYKKKNYIELSKKIREMLIKNNLKMQSKINYKKSKEYDKKILNAKRNSYYREFCNEE